MKKFLITIQYRGENYCGFQKQPTEKTIQGELEKALSEVFKQNVEIFASGRTDAGVHAINQTAHFEVDTTIPAGSIPFAVNIILPDDIKVLSCKEVPADFHARFNVRKKTYEYKMYVSEHILPLLDTNHYQLKKQPDFNKMKDAAKVLLGKHNFKSFASSGNQTKDFVRHIYDIKLSQKERVLTIEISGNGFLYNMVRIIVGTLLEVGYGRKTVEDVKKALDAEDRRLAGFLVPAKALYLKEVKY